MTGLIAVLIDFPICEALTDDAKPAPSAAAAPR